MVTMIKDAIDAKLAPIIDHVATDPRILYIELVVLVTLGLLILVRAAHPPAKKTEVSDEENTAA